MAGGGVLIRRGPVRHDDGEPEGRGVQLRLQPQGRHEGLVPSVPKRRKKRKGHFTLCTLHTFHTSHFNTSHVRASHFSHFSTARRTLQHSFEDVALYDVALQAPPLIHASSRGCGIPEKIHLQEGKRVLKSDPVYHKGKSKPCGGPPNDEEKKSKPYPAPEKR